MIKINKCYLEDYSIDEKNSVKEEKASFDYPGHKAEIALNIKSIMVEEKTILLRELKIGKTVNFNIDQNISYEYYDKKKKDYDDANLYVKGEGSGEIIEIKYYEDSCEDDEFQEVEIILSEGYAENL